MAALERRRRQETEPQWPEFHAGQMLAWDSAMRTVAMCAGSQAGKTAFGPWWTWREIQRTHGGDHLAITATYDLFKLKMLPSMLEVFEGILGVGRYWAGDRVMELRDPVTGQFWAKKSIEPMWGRIILRSAESLGGLESATARSGWLDEAGQDSFTIEAWRAIRRRLALAQGRVLITTTLYNLGWLVRQIIDRAVNGGLVQIHEIGDVELEHTINEKVGIDLIQFDSILNPEYPRAEYEEARRTMPNDEFQMFYRGRKSGLRGIIYDAFDRQMHTCPRFPIPDDWPRFMGLDFGGVNTAAILLAEEPDTKRLYAYREYLAGGRTSKEHTAHILAGEHGRPITIGGAKSEGQWRQEFRAVGLPIREPAISDVMVGIQRVYSVLKSGGLIFFDDLDGTLDQMGHYRHKRDRNGDLIDEIENKNAYHYLDALRYILATIRQERAKMRVLTVEYET